MMAVGEALLTRRGFSGNYVKMGFHLPPFTSVQHLHLHCLSLPLKNTWRGIK
jgi:sulfate adenylyltransferase (ADP) / adenylylsulfatase